ncbi:MAG TPA: co-chaperone GroES [Planctomycetota bacterium]|nr:co-chaperone GroES [Planctomycetota bacterium]
MSKKKIALQPLDDRLVLKRLDDETVTSGGIVLPDSAKEKSQKGSVVAVGPGRRLDSGKRAPLEVSVGDTVLFGKYAGSEVKIDGEEYTILRESELLARLS